MDLEDFLRTFKSKYENPFFDKGFALVGEETYGRGYHFHRVGGITKVFGDKNLTISFKKREIILGSALSVYTLSDPYALSEVRVRVNDTDLGITLEDSLDSIFFFNLLFNTIDVLDADNIKISVDFTDLKCLIYLKQVVYYIIDKDHLDSYYRDIELKR